MVEGYPTLLYTTLHTPGYTTPASRPCHGTRLRARWETSYRAKPECCRTRSYWQTSYRHCSGTVRHCSGTVRHCSVCNREAMLAVCNREAMLVGVSLSVIAGRCVTVRHCWSV